MLFLEMSRLALLPPLTRALSRLSRPPRKKKRKQQQQRQQKQKTAKKVYGTSLANVDWLHGGAESLLTVTNLLLVVGLRRAVRDAEAAKEEGGAAAAAGAGADGEAAAAAAEERASR
jgi:hypothetical protein